MTSLMNIILLYIYIHDRHTRLGFKGLAVNV